VSAPVGLEESSAGDGVLRWELCDPARRNPVGPAILEWIATRCAELRGEVVVLAARTAHAKDGGSEVFCAGFDLRVLAESPVPSEATAAPDEVLGRAVAAMRTAEHLVVALRGRVIGAGVELVCACDLRIAAEGVDFEIPAARLGVVYRAEGLAVLQHAFGPAVVRRLVLLGDRIDHATALAVGAVTSVVAIDRLEAEVARVVDRLRRSPPLGLAGNRDLLRALAPGVPPGLGERHEQRRRAAFAAASVPQLPGRGRGEGALLSSPAMGLKDDIDARMRQARRDRDERTLNVIGMLKNKVLMELKSGSGAQENDELWMNVLSGYAKQLRKSIPEFEKAGERGKEALADVAFELGFVEQFLPAKLDEAATEALVRKIVEEQNLAGQGAKATGRVMGLLMKQHKDELDSELTKSIVQRVLGA